MNESVGAGGLPIPELDEWIASRESGAMDVPRTDTAQHSIWQTVRFNVGSARFPVNSGVPVGDRLVPTPIEALFPGLDGTPSVALTIEVVSGVPRCVDLRFEAHQLGREVRPKDLKGVNLEQWVEGIVGGCSVPLTVEGDKIVVGGAVGADFEDAARSIQRSRQRSRRPMTRERLERVAQVYNETETHGIEAVADAFNCSHATASRYVRAARDADLVQDRRRNRG